MQENVKLRINPPDNLANYKLKQRADVCSRLFKKRLFQMRPCATYRINVSLDGDVQWGAREYFHFDRKFFVSLRCRTARLQERSIRHHVPPPFAKATTRLE